MLPRPPALPELGLAAFIRLHLFSVFLLNALIPAIRKTVDRTQIADSERHPGADTVSYAAAFRNFEDRNCRCPVTANALGCCEMQLNTMRCYFFVDLILVHCNAFCLQFGRY